MDPFFALGYNADIDFEASDIPKGVGAHPHAGFEVVTLVYKGKIAHEDSRGNKGVIGEGDVQWITAGSGILHKEFHEEEWSKHGGRIQMVQLWLNLPAKDKYTDPHYQDLLYKDMTKVELDNSGGFVNVIAGEYKGNKGKATTYLPVNIFNAYLNKDGIANFSFPNNFTTAILVIDGGLLINDTEEIKKDSFVLFENDGEAEFTLKGTSENTVVLMLSALPLNEPVAHYGPFVMSTQEQLAQIFEDYKSGKFGNL